MYPLDNSDINEKKKMLSKKKRTRSDDWEIFLLSYLSKGPSISLSRIKASTWKLNYSKFSSHTHISDMIIIYFY